MTGLPLHTHRRTHYPAAAHAGIMRAGFFRISA